MADFGEGEDYEELEQQEQEHKARRMRRMSSVADTLRPADIQALLQRSRRKLQALAVSESVLLKAGFLTCGTQIVFLTAAMNELFSFLLLTPSLLSFCDHWHTQMMRAMAAKKPHSTPVHPAAQALSPTLRPASPGIGSRSEREAVQRPEAIAEEVRL